MPNRAFPTFDLPPVPPPDGGWGKDRTLHAFHIRLAGLVTGVAALIGPFLPVVAAADLPPDQIPDDLKAAIAAYIEGRGHVYAGLGPEVNAGDPASHVGEYVAFVQSIEHDIAEVTYGPVLSDAIGEVSFHNVGGTWQLAVAPPGPGSPTPRVPQTGSGAAAGTTGGTSFLMFALAGAGALSIAGFATVVAARRR